jgi:large subunit ribosomal protein L29
MKAEELRAYTLAELHKLLRQKREELAKLRYQNAQSPLPKAPSLIPSLRKDIARILTVINEKRRAYSQPK